MPDPTPAEVQHILGILLSTPFREGVPISRDFNRLPFRPGLYAVKQSSETILYIGRARTLRTRFASGHKAFTWAWLDDYDHREIGITYYLLNWEEGLKAQELEAAIIQRLRPRYNSVIRKEE